MAGSGTRADPWTLQTPSLQSEFTAFRDEAAAPPALIVQVGKTELRYHLRCLDDLHAMLKAHGDWMPLGSADEQKPDAIQNFNVTVAAHRRPASHQPAISDACRKAPPPLSEPHWP